MALSNTLPNFQDPSKNPPKWPKWPGCFLCGNPLIEHPFFAIEGRFRYILLHRECAATLSSLLKTDAEAYPEMRASTPDRLRQVSHPISTTGIENQPDEPNEILQSIIDANEPPPPPETKMDDKRLQALLEVASEDDE